MMGKSILIKLGLAFFDELTLRGAGHNSAQLAMVNSPYCTLFQRTCRAHHT